MADPNDPSDLSNDVAATTLPTDPNDPNTALAQLLQKELAAQQAHEAQAAKNSSDDAPLFFGMTMGAIFLGFVISVVGVALANYGRVTSNVVFVVCGVAMMAIPFFVTSSLGLAIIGGVVFAIPLVLRRLRAI